MLLLIILLLLLLGGGGWVYNQWGPGPGMSIAGVVLLIIVLLLLFGGLNIGTGHGIVIR